MASDFPAYVAKGYEFTMVDDYVAGTGASEPFLVGDFWYYNTTNNETQLCGADPALIGGISEVSSAAAALLTPDAKVPVRKITGKGCIIAMASTTTPAITHIGDEHGITRNASNHWLLDVGKTTTDSRMRVEDVDIANGIFYCSVNPLVLQFSLETATS